MTGQTCRTFGSIRTAAGYVTKYLPADQALDLVQAAMAEGQASDKAAGVYVWRWDESRVRVVATTAPLATS